MNSTLWDNIRKEIELRVGAEPSLGSFLYSLVLSQNNLSGAVASILSSKLHSDALSAMDIKKFILDVFSDCKNIEKDLTLMLKKFNQSKFIKLHSNCIKTSKKFDIKNFKKNIYKLFI